MKVLVLSCNTGQGHNAAGSALTEKMQALGVNCQMRDALAFAGERFSKVISQSYIHMATRAPSVFNMIYQMGSAITNRKLKSPVYLANITYARNLLNYLKEEQFDAVVTLHLFPAEALTYLKRTKGLSVPCYSVATDYTCIPFCDETELEGYFIPHRDLIDEFVKKGIPKDKLIPIGIPVSDRFTQKTDQKTARAKLGIPPSSGPIYLVMTGSMGYGNVEPLIDALLGKNPGQIIVMGGNNETLKQSLRRRYNGEGRVQVLDYTDQVSDYMDACDVLLTKPGGLTSTEAAVKTLPIIHTRPIPGCETKNARFFADHGLSLCPNGNDEKLVSQAAALASDPLRQEKMANAQRATISPSACEDICRWVMENAGKK